MRAALKMEAAVALLLGAVPSADSADACLRKAAAAALAGTHCPLT
jgi:hypothetical protein